MGYQTVKVSSWLLFWLFCVTALFNQNPFVIPNANNHSIKDSSSFSYSFPKWELVTSVDWSNNGQWIAVAAGNKVYIFESPSWELKGFSDIGVFSGGLTFGPNPTWLASAGKDGKIRLWQVNNLLEQADQSFVPDKIFRFNKKGANSIDFNSDGSLLTIGGNDPLVRIWNVKKEEWITEIIGGSFSIPSVAFHPKRNILAIANGRMIYLKDPFTGRLIGSFRSQDPFYQVAFNQNGDLLAASDINNSVMVWNVDSANQSSKNRYPTPIVQYVHDGKTAHYSGLVWGIRFSPVDRWVASAGGDGSVRLWDLAQAKIIKMIQAHQGAVTCLAFSPDGKWLITGGLDAMIKLWNLDPH
jgi:WD40 repeat protein